DMPPSLIERYFNLVDGAYEVKKAVRGLVVFGQHDLGQRAPFPRIDLTLCRNVLIYFTTELQRRALQLFAFALRDNGYLALGKSETVTPLPHLFVLDEARLKVYRRTAERILIPIARLPDRSSLSTSPFPIPNRSVAPVGQAQTRPNQDLQRARNAAEKA